MRVTFFGHRQVLEDIQPLLESTIEDLILHHNANCFYVGNQGEFDSMVYKTLKELKVKYPQISYAVVLAYMPPEGKNIQREDMPTLYPDGLETVPRKFAISFRNRWLIDHSDTVISYVTYSVGGAATFTALAEKRGKEVIRL